MQLCTYYNFEKFPFFLDQTCFSFQVFVVFFDRNVHLIRFIFVDCVDIAVNLFCWFFNNQKGIAIHCESGLVDFLSDDLHALQCRGLVAVVCAAIP